MIINLLADDAFYWVADHIIVGFKRNIIFIFIFLQYKKRVIAETKIYYL